MKKIQTSIKVKNAEDWNTHRVDYRVLVMGLESSGKSSIIHVIVCNEFAQNVSPTKGVKVTPYLTNGKRIIFHEVGGHIESRGWMKFYYSCDAVIFVIDSTQTTELTKASDDIDVDYYSDDLKSDDDTEDIPTTPPSSTTKPETYEYTDKNTGNLSPIPNFAPCPIPKLSSNASLDKATFTFLEEPMSPISPDDEKVDRPKFGRSHSEYIQNKNGTLKLKQRSSIGPSNPLENDHKNYLFAHHQITTRKRGDTLKPLTMNEAKCHSAQELLSKLNYDLRDYGIPFLIYLNKQDRKEAMSEADIIKKLKFKRIIHKLREYGTFCCNARNDKDGINRGFKWLLQRLDDRKMREKQSAKINAKRMSQSGVLFQIDLSKYGPTVKNPKCVICDVIVDNKGSYCTVCGKWYCHRDKLTKMMIRKSGSKCKFCVGQKSRFIADDFKSKRKRSQTN